MKQTNYPQNLLDAIADKYLYRPKIITEDILAGLNYALSTLSLLEQDFIKLRFQLEKSIDDICTELCLPPDVIEELEKRAIKKLRHPWVHKYILYGIVGYTLHKSIAEFYKGYQHGYDDAKAGKENISYMSKKPGLTLDTPSVEVLALSKRTLNCLIKAGITSIGDCLMLRIEDIRAIKGLGTIGADEVARALVNAHIFSYNWEMFLIEPRLTRDLDEYHTEVL